MRDSRNDGKFMREKWKDSILSGCLVERGERKISCGARVFSPRTHQKVFSPMGRKLKGRKAQFELNKMPTCMVHMGIIHLFLPFLFYFWCCIDILAFLFFFFFFFFFFWAGRVLAICFFFSFFVLLVVVLKTEPACPSGNRVPIWSNKNAKNLSKTKKNREPKANLILPPVRFLKPCF